MDIVTDANELARRLRMLAFGGKAPAEIENRLQTIPGSQADLLTEGAEVLYAHYDLLPKEAKELVGQLYFYADQQGWTTFNRDGRSRLIVSLVRRDLGEKGAGVAKAADEWPDPEAQRRDGGLDWRNASAAEA